MTMNMIQDRDLAIKYDAICRKLKESGADLSRIKIATNDGAKRTSYITRRIIDEIGRKTEND